MRERAEQRNSSANTVGARIALASFGGLALIFPMLIMVLDASVASRLCVRTSSRPKLWSEVD